MAAAAPALAGNHANTSINMSKAVLTSTSSASHSSPVKTVSSDGKMERRCVMMSCGTPWCYNAKVR